MELAKNFLIRLLRWSEKYTRTDMVYFAKGSFWLILGKTILMFISIFTLMAFANWLPVETYGEYQFVLSVAGILTIFSLPGIKTALIRSVARGFESSLMKAFKVKLRWSLFSSLFLLILSGWYFFNGNLNLFGAFLIIALIIPIKSASSVFIEYWQGKKRFDLQIFYQISADIFIALAVITTLFLTNNLWIIVLVFFGVSALSYTVMYGVTKRSLINNTIDEGMASFGKHMTLMGTIGLIASYLDKIIIWKLLGPIHLATYVFALKPIEKLTGLIPIKVLALTKLSQNGVGNMGRKKSVFRKFLLILSFTTFFALILAILSPYIYKIFFPQYMESVTYFRALCVLIAFLPFTILGTALVVEEKIKYMYISQIAIPIFKIIMFVILTPIYGLAGMVSAIILSEFLRGGMSTYFFWKM